MADGYTAHGTPVPEWWVGQVHRGKQFRRQYAHEDDWPRWRRWYRGEWDPQILPSNVYFKMMRTLIPRIYYRNPSVSITPSVPGVEAMLLAKLLERADNKLIDIMGVKEQMKRSVQHGIMFGTGGLRLGYGAEFTPTPDDLDTEAPDTGGASVQRRVEYNDLVHPNMPWALSAHPGNVIVPHGAMDIHSARWVCYECNRTLDDVKADPRFKNTKELGGGGGDSRLIARSQATTARDREGVTLWEIRDKKTGLVFVLAPYSNVERPDGKILFCEQDDLQIDGRLPFYPLIFNNDDEVFWGISDSIQISPQQGEKNEIRTQLRNHRRIAIAKLLYEAGSINPDELSKLIDGNALSAVSVKNIAGIMELNMSGVAQIIQILENTENVIDAEIEQILGLGVNQFGEYAPGSADRSATEAGIVASASQIRTDERRDACADLLTDLISGVNHVLVEHWDSEMILDIAGPAGVPLWIKVRPSLFKNLRYDTKVDPDTSLPLTKALREQKAVQLYGILKPNPLIDPQHLTQFLLNEMYGVDANFLLCSPLANTSPSNPMDMRSAVQHMQALPAPSGGTGGPAQIIPPTLQV